MTASVEELTASLQAELASLEGELREIAILMTQAETEAKRHGARRDAALEQWQKMAADPKAGPEGRTAAAAQLATLTRRAAVMEAQVEVLAAKDRVLRRAHVLLSGVLQAVQALPVEGGGRAAEGVASETGQGGVTMPPTAGALAGVPPEAEVRATRDEGARGHPDSPAGLSPAVSRLVLAAQEDLRRAIARAMHDGPAQSLTNIILQAEIVERLLQRDPAAAAAEVRGLVEMVERSLEATKAFIFDVRPMVLDDLGLVPTLRRAARERGRRARIPVEFDSVGQDRRLPMELETGLFRLLDDLLAAYLELRPDRLRLRLDWTDRLSAEMVAVGRPVAVAPVSEDLPPALMAMIEERQRTAEATARVSLPIDRWQEVAERAKSVGVSAELLDDGSRVRLTAPLAEEDGG
jgi:signal transduction histidine kinase